LKLALPSTWESITSLAMKRIKMITYLKNIYMSKSLYFNTVIIQRDNIKNHLESPLIKRR
jgi:hypothetical protein